MPLHVTVPPGGRLNAGQLHGALHPALDGHVVIDLRASAWVEPVGLVMIAALAGRHVVAGGTLDLVGPGSPSIARYLSRMRLVPCWRAWGNGTTCLQSAPGTRSS